MLLRMTPIPSLANWDLAGPLPEVLGVSVLVSTLLALFVIHRVSMKRGLFPSVVAGGVVWVAAMAVLFGGTILLLQLYTGNVW